MKIAFLFPGQGSQFVGMASDYYHTFPNFRDTIYEISDYAKKDIPFLIFNGTQDNLNRPQNAQLSLFGVCLGIFSTIQAQIPKISFYAGHSFGEIVAYTASKVFDRKVGASIILKRGQFMEEINNKNGGSMLAIIGSERHFIQNLCEEVSRKINPVYIAAFNSPSQIVISGYKNSLDFIKKNIPPGIKAFPLNIDGALHTPIVNDIKNKFKDFLKDIPIKDPEIPVFSSFEGKQISKENIKESLSKNITQPVLWQQIIENLIQQNTKVFVEISPTNILQNILKKFKGDFQILGTENLTTLTKTLNILNDICYREQ